MFAALDSFVTMSEPFVLRFGNLVMVLVILLNLLLLCLAAKRARKDKPMKGWFIFIILVWILSLVALAFFVYVNRSITPLSYLGIE